MHTVSHHALRRILGTRKLGKLQERKLARLIGTHARPKTMGPHGAHVDDGLQAIRSAQQQRQESPGGPIDAAVVDLPRRPVLVRVRVGERARRLEGAGVVDQDVQARKGRLRRGGGARHGREVLHVELEAEDLWRGLPGGAGGGAQLGGEAGQVGARGDGDL